MSEKKEAMSTNCDQPTSGDVALYALSTDKGVEATCEGVKVLESANKMQEGKRSSIYLLTEQKLKVYLVVLSLAVLFLLLALVICMALAFTKIAKINSDLESVQEKSVVMLSSMSKSELDLESKIERVCNDSVGKILLLIEQLNIRVLENSLRFSNVSNKADESISNIFTLIQQLNLSVFDNSDKADEYVSVIMSLIDDLIVNNSGLELLIHNLTNTVTDLNISFVMERNTIYEYISSFVNETIGGSYSSPAPSCQAIYQLQPSPPTSGYYWLRSANGSSVRVYCEMNITCGGSRGGMMRVGLIDNSNRRNICNEQSELIILSNNGSRCGISTVNTGGCSHTIFNVMNVRYSHICGTVEGYGVNSPDGFESHDSARTDNAVINDNYVDGISLTLDSPNTTHVWTFVAQHRGGNAECPDEVPSYVGDDYSCLPVIRHDGAITYPPNVDNSPSFNRTLSQPTSDNIEMRLCRDQNRNDEDIVIENVMIYVR